MTVTVDGTTVGSMHLMEVNDILKGFNAIDWDVLDLGGFLTTVPASSDAFSDITDTVSYPNYLWLLEQTVEQGGTRTINSRNVAVYALISVEEDATNTGKFNLVFWRVT